MAQVWELDLPPNEKFLLQSLADHADDNGEHIHPSVARLVWKTGWSERTVQRLLRKLEATEILEPVAYAQGGYGMATDYRINIEKGVKLAPFVPAGAPARVSSVTTRVTSTTDTVSPVAPQPSEPSLQPSVEEEGSKLATIAGAAGSLTVVHPERVYRAQLKDALVAMQGWDPADMTKDGWGRIEAAAKQLADIGADPAEIPYRAGNYLVNNPGKLTPNALAANWADCASPRIRPSSKDLERAARGERMIAEAQQ